MKLARDKRRRAPDKPVKNGFIRDGKLIVVERRRRQFPGEQVLSRDVFSETIPDLATRE